MNIGFALFTTFLCCWFVVTARTQTALYAVAFASFIGTYVINQELGRPLLPGPLVALLAVLRFLLYSATNNQQILVNYTGRKWLFLLFAYVLCTTFIVPTLFHGSIEVIRPGLIVEDFRFAVPLELSISNMGQMIYFALDVALISISARVAWNDSKFLEKFTKKLVQFAYIIGVLIVVDALLNVFMGSVDVFGYLMGNTLGEFRPDRYALSGVVGLPLRRAQGVFGEPSFFSAFAVGALGASFVFLRNSGGFGNKLTFTVILVSLALTFSTTAYVGAAIVLLTVALTPVQGYGERRLGTLVIAFGFIVILIGGGALWLLSVQDLSSYIFEKLSDTEGFERGNFSSGAERLYWDMTAIKALVDSFGLGVGVGSTRASSAFINVAASFGLFGAIIFISLVFFVLRTMFMRRELSNSCGIHAGSVIIFGWLVAFSISVPDITSFFYFHIALGALLGSWAFHKRRVKYNTSSTKYNVGAEAGE